MKDRILAFARKHIDVAFKLLRIFLPICKFGDLVLVSRFRDVEEVLSRPDVFGVTYAEKMGVITNGGNFFLGMNDTATYERDVSNMRVLMPRADVAPVIKPLVGDYAQHLVDGLGGNFDFVNDLSTRVPAYFCREYIGTPGPDEQRMVAWTTYMFEYLFYPEFPREVEEKAVSYAAETRAYLDDLIVGRKADNGVNDVIARAVALQRAGTPGMTDEDIRNNVIGIIIGAIPTTSMAASLVLDYLLDHPARLQSAQALARRGDDDKLGQLVLETLRFKPFGAGVFRDVLADYRLARGSWRSKKVKRGDKVIVLTQSAMMDGRVVEKPGKYALDRPRHIYMPFGYGLHRCFGFYINLVQIPAILRPVLKKSQVRRADGEAGVMQYRGPFPSRLNIVVSDD